MNRKVHPPPYRFSPGICIYLSAFAILTGGMLYILFRPSKPLFFRFQDLALGSLGLATVIMAGLKIYKTKKDEKVHE